MHLLVRFGSPSARIARVLIASTAQRYELFTDVPQEGRLRENLIFACNLPGRAGSLKKFYSRRIQPPVRWKEPSLSSLGGQFGDLTRSRLRDSGFFWLPPGGKDPVRPSTKPESPELNPPSGSPWYSTRKF